MAGYCRDKKLRLYDPRKNSTVSESDAHQGTKGARVNWFHNVNKIFTVGFTKIAERQFMIWDPRDMSKPLITQDIDVASGLLMPFYDNESSVLFLAGKGDGNVRYYEIKDEEPYIYFLSEYKTNSPQRGMGALPKYAVDVNSCEIFRLYKLENNKVTPISFEVPRKSNLFQEDLFPDSLAPEPALNAADWFGGADAEPKTTSMKPGENKYKGVARSNTFKPSAEAATKAPETKLPPKTNDPKQLLTQNEELRKRVEDLEKELFSVKQKLAQHESA
jgi:coronin-1B/1C/6